MKNVILVLFLAGFSIALSSELAAHDAFKEPLKHRYNLKSVSCKTCHPDSKDRSIHNKFGMMFVAEFKGLDISKKFKEAEAKGKEAVAEYEKEMKAAFNKAIVEVEKKQLTIKDLIDAGLLNGLRLNKPKDKKSKDK